MTARKADGLTGCREDGVTAYRGEPIQWEGGVPGAKGGAMIGLPAVVFWWSIYTIVIIAFVFHLAAG